MIIFSTSTLTFVFLQAPTLQPLQNSASSSCFWETSGALGPVDYHGWRCLSPTVPGGQGQLRYWLQIIQKKIQKSRTSLFLQLIVISFDYRHCFWQVWCCGDRPCLSTTGGAKFDITGNPTGVSWVVNSEHHQRRATGLPQQTTVSSRLHFLIHMFKKPWSGVKCWTLLLHVPAVHNFTVCFYWKINCDSGFILTALFYFLCRNIYVQQDFTYLQFIQEVMVRSLTSVILHIITQTWLCTVYIYMMLGKQLSFLPHYNKI